jgi:hypothetical protein
MFLATMRSALAGRPRPRRGRRAAFRADLERLEARVALASAEVFTWTGASSANWSDPGNWDTGTAPTPGFTASLLFPSEGAVIRRQMINDLTFATFDALVFQGDGYSLSGGVVNLNQLANTAGVNTINLVVSMVTSSANIATNTGSTLVLTSPLAISSQGVTLNGPAEGDFPVDGGGAIQVEGTISGLGGVSVGGLGTVTLSGENNYQGGTEVFGAGRLIVGTNTALGTGPATLNLLSASRPVTLANAMTMRGSASLDGPAPITLTGSVVLTSTLGINPSGSGATHTLSGPVSGPGSISLQGGGLVLPNANRYTGGTSIQQATLTVGSGLALGGGPLIFQAGQIQATAPVTIGNPFQAIGNAIIGGGQDLTFTGPGTVSSPIDIATTATVTFDGMLSGTGGFQMQKAGTLVVNGGNTLGGRNELFYGTTVVNGSLGTGQTILGAGGTLTGTGSVGELITLGPATVAPGTPGALGGALRANGQVALNAESVFRVVLTDPNTGINDRLNSRDGGIFLANPTLSVQLGFTPPRNQIFGFPILTSTGGGVTGTFAGLPNKARLTIGGRAFEIVYGQSSVQLITLNPLEATARFDPSPYAAALATGPARTAADLNGDGVDERITTTTNRRGRFVTVHDGRTGRRIQAFPLRTPFRDGLARVTTAEVNGDGTPDIVVATGPARRPLLGLYDGRTGALLRTYRAPAAR